MATDAEQTECDHLFTNNLGGDIDPDDGNIPTAVKKAADPAPPPFGDPAEPDEPTLVEDPASIDDPAAVDRPVVQNDQAAVEKPAVEDDQAAVATPDLGETNTHAHDKTAPTEATAPVHRDVNTTAFAHWPEPTMSTSELPNVFRNETIDEKAGDAERLKWLNTGLHHPDRESDTDERRGVHFLGAGALGRVGLRIRRDENNRITERIAAKDVPTMSPEKWMDPVRWRDRLPREIAIQLRLNEQNGHDHNIHRYLGHRISSQKRRYRGFNEVCELSDGFGALSGYSPEWAGTRNLVRWNEAHPEIDAAKKRLDETKMRLAEADAQVNTTIKAAWNEYVQERDARTKDRAQGVYVAVDKTTEHYQRTNVELDKMPGLERWLYDDLFRQPQKIIEETFIWHVFDLLAVALLILKNWNDNTVEGKLSNRNTTETEVTIEYGENEWPRVVLADWDQAFFDLQSGADAYWAKPDISTFWMLIIIPQERYLDYEVHQNGLEKLTSKTDVWGLGQMMWCLVLQTVETKGPFFDDKGTRGKKLTNGKPYNPPTDKNLLSGTEPYICAKHYTDDLKDLIRSCLRYRTADKPTIEEVKIRTAAGVVKTRMTGSRVELRVERALHGFTIGEEYPRKKRKLVRGSERNKK
ncbi:hypothetical protein CC86DRAFT_388785 [Ophiobolus disseminans]|uniref:Protein kinase domain-containing protein n=1 Tax=Ophiobolus disseminans TaxID=1469910 RepID=A0A6A6ZDA0_9PLEO|nr:hypothetical protein CC86DRAFT_388785 [Ophiobolus disseminans]